MSIRQNKVDVAQNISEATRLLATAAENAMSTLASAAESATKVIANSAAEAAKAVEVKDSGDHDLLIKLETKMDALKEDIKDIKDGTSKKIGDHEARIGKLDDFKNTQTILNAIGLALIIVLAGIILYHVGLTGSGKIL